MKNKKWCQGIFEHYESLGLFVIEVDGKGKIIKLSSQFSNLKTTVLHINNLLFEKSRGNPEFPLLKQPLELLFVAPGVITSMASVFSVPAGNDGFIYMVNPSTTRSNHLENEINTGLYSLIHEEDPRPLIVLNRKNRIISLNERFQKYFQVTQEEIVGNMTCVTKELRNIPEEFFSKVHSSSTFFFKSFFNRKDVHIKITSLPLIGSAGEYRGVILIFEDKTEFQKTLFLNRLFSAGLENIEEGVIVTDLKGRIIYVNSAYSKITGYSVNDLLGSNPRKLKSGAHSKEFYEDLWNVILSGKNWSGELINRRSNGEEYYEDAHITPLKIGAKVEHFLAIKRDITDKMKVQRNEESKKRLESIGILAMGISHNINNILTAISASTENFALENKKEKETVDIIRKLIEKGRNATSRLLEYSRKQSINLMPMKINDFFSSNQRDYENILSEGIEMDVTCESELSILADPSRIKEIFLNLVKNADEAMSGQGRVTIICEQVIVSENEPEFKRKFYSPPSGEYVMIRVMDTGPGIPEKIISRIFEPYFTTASRNEKSGLGLATVYGMVRKMGGRIIADNSRAGGAVFTLIFPIIKEGLPKKIIQQASQGKQSRRILFVEDDPLIRDAVSSILRKKGFDLDVGCDGADGLEKFLQGDYFAIITDLVMPKMNGNEMIEEIRKIDKKVKIIITTGFMDESITPSEDHDYSYIQKPYRISELEKFLK